MSLTDMVIMPGADYKDACDAVREKTGGTADIKSGELGAQIRGISTGVELPELTNPASASDIVRNKEAIDGEGNVITGNILDGGVGSTHTFVSSKAEPQMVNAGSLNIMSAVDFCSVSSLNDMVLRSNSPVKMTVYGQTFGDATAEDVAAGKTFTSTAGLKVTGTAAGGGGADYSAVTFNKVRVVVTDKAVGVLAVAYVDAENGGNIQTWTQVVGGATVNTIYNLPVNAIYSSAQVIGADYATPIPVYIGNGNGTLTLTTDRDVFLGNK